MHDDVFRVSEAAAIAALSECIASPSKNAPSSSSIQSPIISLKLRSRRFPKPYSAIALTLKAIAFFLSLTAAIPLVSFVNAQIRKSSKAIAHRMRQDAIAFSSPSSYHCSKTSN